MPAFGNQLAQTRPSGTSAVSAFSARKREQLTITRITVCNQTGSAAAYSIFHDDDGATFDEGTALFFGVSLPANSTDVIECGSGEDEGLVVAESGQIGVKTGTGSAITFTIYGHSGVRR